MKKKQLQFQYKTTERLSSERLNEILKIKEKYGLTAENLIECAKNKNSPLHDVFNWNDKSAGHYWRMHQARLLINEVKIIVEDKELYAFENMKVNIGTPQEQHVYLGREEILSSASLRKQFVANALQKLKYWKEQCESYNGIILREFEPVFSSIEEVDKKLTRK